MAKMHNVALEMRLLNIETDMNTRFDIYSDYTAEVESSHFLYYLSRQIPGSSCYCFYYFHLQ